MTTLDASGANETADLRHDAGVSDVVNRYLDRFYHGDFVRAGAVVAAEFTFTGPFLEVHGKDAFFAGAAGLQQIVRGHHLLRQWADGADVCSVYDVQLETPAGVGVIPMSEWHTVRDGQLVAGRVLFDSAAFRALLPSADA